MEREAESIMQSILAVPLLFVVHMNNYNMYTAIITR